VAGATLRNSAACLRVSGRRGSEMIAVDVMPATYGSGRGSLQLSQNRFWGDLLAVEVQTSNFDGMYAEDTTGVYYLDTSRDSDHPRVSPIIGAHADLNPVVSSRVRVAEIGSLGLAHLEQLVGLVVDSKNTLPIPGRAREPIPLVSLVSPCSSRPPMGSLASDGGHSRGIPRHRMPGHDLDRWGRLPVAFRLRRGDLVQLQHERGRFFLPRHRDANPLGMGPG
jgi:hypothetical protein